VVLIKNHEFKKQILIDSDDDDDEKLSKVKGIGTQRLNRKDVDDQKLEKENYKKLMSELYKETRFNYIGCSYFQSLNKIIYLWMVVCQLIQTMVFNGLFDIP
jgi:hypothetical protein